MDYKIQFLFYFFMGKPKGGLVEGSTGGKPSRRKGQAPALLGGSPSEQGGAILPDSINLGSSLDSAPATPTDAVPLSMPDPDNDPDNDPEVLREIGRLRALLGRATEDLGNIRTPETRADQFERMRKDLAEKIARLQKTIDEMSRDSTSENLQKLDADDVEFVKQNVDLAFKGKNQLLKDLFLQSLELLPKLQKNVWLLSPQQKATYDQLMAEYQVVKERIRQALRDDEERRRVEQDKYIEGLNREKSELSAQLDALFDQIRADSAASAVLQQRAREAELAKKLRDKRESEKLIQSVEERVRQLEAAFTGAHKLFLGLTRGVADPRRRKMIAKDTVQVVDQTQEPEGIDVLLLSRKKDPGETDADFLKWQEDLTSSLKGALMDAAKNGDGGEPLIKSVRLIYPLADRQLEDHVGFVSQRLSGLALITRNPENPLQARAKAVVERFNQVNTLRKAFKDFFRGWDNFFKTLKKDHDRWNGLGPDARRAAIAEAKKKREIRRTDAKIRSIMKNGGVEFVYNDRRCAVLFKHMGEDRYRVAEAAGFFPDVTRDKPFTLQAVPESLRQPFEAWKEKQKSQTPSSS